MSQTLQFIRRSRFNYIYIYVLWLCVYMYIWLILYVRIVYILILILGNFFSSFGFTYNECVVWVCKYIVWCFFIHLVIWFLIVHFDLQYCLLYCENNQNLYFKINIESSQHFTNKCTFEKTLWFSFGMCFMINNMCFTERILPKCFITLHWK